MGRALEEALSVYAEEDITVAASSVGLTLTNVTATPPVKKVELFVETAQIRFRQDGSAPTSAVGEVANPFDRIYLWGPEQAYKFRAIRTGGTSANIRARYLR